MHPKLLYAATIAVCTAAPVLAQLPRPERLIQVVGSATVRTPPDVATLVYWLRGEGTTADQATAALVASQEAVEGGLTGLLRGATEITTGNVMLIETRDRGCDTDRSQPRLSQGACAPTGYLATIESHVRTTAVDKAGTAVGLAARLGARDARLMSFQLADPAEAQRRATLAAIRDARTKAEAAAAGAGVALGPLLSVSDQVSGLDPVVAGSRVADAPAPPPPPPPIEIGLKPRPIETRAQVTLRYGISP